MMFFADASGPEVHVAPLDVFHIGSFHITNSMFYGWISITLICILLVWAARKMTVMPKGGAIQYVEAAAEFVINFVENAFDNKKTGRKYVPFFMTLFFFILCINWLGLVPGVGDAVRSGDNPLLRPFTADLNATLGMGLITMVFVYAASIKESGGFTKYIRHFFVGNPLNPIYFLIGVIEMLTDLTRALSLALRLFLNVAIGEIVIGIFAWLGHIGAPISALPFTLLELFIGALQAYIFAILATMYLAIAVNGAAHGHDAHADDLTTEDVPEIIKKKARKAAV